MKTYLLNPTLQGQSKFIREGRCMQKASSWATAWPPITLALMGVLASCKGSVRLLDGNVTPLSLQALVEDIQRHDTDLLVINTGFASINDDMRVAKAVKEKLPHVKVLAVGLFFTLMDRKGVELYPFLDFAIFGEIEETFKDLCESLCSSTEDLSKIDGLMFTDAEGIHVNRPRPYIQDLDRLPFPDRSLLKNNRYRLPHNNKMYTLVNTARGCPHRCSFCIVDACYGSHVRRHSLEYILKEIESCVYDFGIREFLFWEEGFTLDKNFVSEFCKEVQQRQLLIKWTTTTRVTSVDQDMLAQMKAAGCHLLGFGIESLNQKILDNVRKKQTVKDICRAVQLCKDTGIDTMGHLVFGLPGETRETAAQTIQLAKEIGLTYIQCYCAVPYPKTALGEMAQKKGWVQASDWAQLNVGGKASMCNESLTSDEITALRNQAFREFYLRPGYILKTAFNFLSIRLLIRITIFFDWMTVLGGKYKRSAVIKKR